ncbi:MAG: hypothetical protein PUC68_03610, partial [Firmicutes bacterium]|nr:hypothetical protein [Bacillota bacterium]
EVDDEGNPHALFNTHKAKPGQVLDSTKTDGSVVDFKAYNEDVFALYDEDTGDVILKDNSLKLFTLEDDEPVKVEIYFWLEGCDEDCANNLVGQSLETLSIKFVGKVR